VKRTSIVAGIVAGVLWTGLAGAYPLDGYEATGINRLRAYDLARAFLLKHGQLQPGSLWTSDQIRPWLADVPDLELPAPDAEFEQSIRALLGDDAKRYGISVLDVTDPANPRFAELNGTRVQNPGSVGKIIVALGWFHALAKLHPGDVPAREKLLREVEITANAFIHNDHHKVPIWKPGDKFVTRRPLQLGDTANVYTYLDWMSSASSNAAASMLMSELVLLREFGSEYPVTDERAQSFWAETSKSALTRKLANALQEPLRAYGLDPAKFRQGSLFTREGKKLLPGINSLATSRELLRFLVKLDQAALVDAWSSRELKRLLYLTDVRARYASSPALNDAAVYFKSGSLYGCKPEEGFTCDKFKGNRINYMNSIAIVETDAEHGALHYMVVVLSNVLRKNSVDAHRALAAELHRLISSQHAATPVEDVPPVSSSER